MVAKGHALGLTVGWYTNNIQCHGQETGWSATPELHELHYQGVAEFLATSGFDEVKVWAPEFRGRNGLPPPEKHELVLSIKMGCTDTVHFQPKPNTPF